MSKGPASSIEPFSEQCLHHGAHSTVNKGGSEEASCSLTGKSLIMKAPSRRTPRSFGVHCAALDLRLNFFPSSLKLA